jgi:outer membrane autotransporter protein
LGSGGGTLASATGATATYGGVISGTGSLSIGDGINQGTVVLNAANTYSGGTIVLAGRLQAGSAGGFVNNTAYTVNGGTLDLNNFKLTVSSLNGTGGVVNLGSAALTIDNTGTDVYSGIIQGTGSLTKIGAGTLTLSGNNTYTGGTNILGGVLSVSSDINLGSGNIRIGSNAELLTTGATFSSGKAIALGDGGGTLASATGATATYGGVISGTGPLSIGDGINKGTVVLNAANTYSGGTLLNAGTLVVNNAQALGLGDVVVNGGVLRADPQPINVRGNYTQNAGGTLQLGLGGSAPGQSDLLNVGGHAALDGTLQLLSLNGFQPKIGDKLTLVLAAGGVSGQFANVLDPFSTSLNSAELVYFPNSVVLEIASNFTAFAKTPNELAVATQLDRVAFDPRETQLLSFLQNEPIGNLAADFEKISPDSLSALYEISFSAANVQASNLENRFAEIRNGSTGFASSLNISNAPGAMVEGSNGKAVIEPGKNVLTPSPENKWGVWISGSGEFVNVSSDGNGKGYDFDTGGVSLGLDYRLTKNLAVGIAARYAHTWTNLVGNGNIDVDSGGGGLYATFFQDGFYLNGYAGGTHNSYDTQRDALGGGASGSTSGGEFDGYAGGGYEFHSGGFSFGPIASLEYTYVDFTGYNERGSLAPLRIESQSQDSLRTSVGVSASYTWKAGKVQLRPSLRASWQHEYFYSALPINAQFVSGAGGVFTVNGPAEGHDSALIDAGLDVQWTPTIGTYFGYSGLVGRSNYDSNSVICSVHWDF